ncbi:MAG: radical SAM protein [Euryarchaeota archaeon]|nr:radical SAM protein [Euryarchaeota archaeon]
MKILAKYGNDELARVWVAQMRDDCRSVVEFVESIQPPIPREEKWVLIISSMFGCPIGCAMCDAGGGYAGLLTKEDILAQIDTLVSHRYPDRKVPCSKFKIQFARMGEPTLNPAVLEALRLLPSIYDAPGLLISLSTVAPARAEKFFDELIEIKETLYRAGQFQLQFSIHTTDLEKRREIIPTKTWTFDQMAAFGERFCCPAEGDRKVTLNFAPMSGCPIDPSVIRESFDPDRFLIKLTPLNPTLRSSEGGWRSIIDPNSPQSGRTLIDEFTREGFDVILSIGEVEENKIGSNCGQFIQRALHGRERPQDAYEIERYRTRSADEI